MIRLINQNKTVFIGVALLTIFILLLVITRPTKSHRFTIGILQTASHPALDAVAKGFKDYLHEKLGNTIAFVERNAQGNASQAQMIAHYFHGEQCLDGIFAIATTAAQAAMQHNSNKPLFVAAVTDPEAIGLKSSTIPACGISDMIDPDKQVTLLKTLVPDAKTVTLFYNIGEINAQTTAKKLHDALIDAGYKIKTVNVTQISEVPLVIDRALKMTDALISPIDNTVACAITFIAQKALEAKVPFIVSDNLLVERGALAAAGVNYYEIGRAAGSCVFEVLHEGKKVTAIDFHTPDIADYVVNKKTFDSLGLDPALLPDNFILV